MYNIYKQIIHGKQFRLKPNIAEKEGYVNQVYWAEADEYKGYTIHRRLSDTDNWIPLLPNEVGELFLAHEAIDFELVHDTKEIEAVLDFLDILCSAFPPSNHEKPVSVLASSSWDDGIKSIEFGFLHCELVDKILHYEGDSIIPILVLSDDINWFASSEFMWATNTNADYRLTLLFDLLEEFKLKECNGKLYEDNYQNKAGIRVCDFTYWVRSQYLNKKA